MVVSGFDLHKGAVRDCLCLRYGWIPSSLPTSCTCTCGSPFSIDHALNCPFGVFPLIRHDGIRDLTARLMREVCCHIVIEPTLQPLSGENLSPRSANCSYGARLDMRLMVSGNVTKDRIIQIEHGCFTPLVFSTAGSLAPAAKVVFNRLASLLALK